MRWKQILLNGEYTKYEISDNGLYRSSWGRRSGLLKINKDKSGYPLAYIYHNKNRYTPKIHRLVAEAFLPNLNGYDTVNHKDGNKANNLFTNLEWCTRSRNMYHAYETGLKTAPKGRDHYLSKPVGRYIDSKLVKSYKCSSDAEKDGFNKQLISQSARILCRHKGFYWKYLDEPIKKTA